jgi:hypothetical protein
MTKTANILRCTLTQTRNLDSTTQLPDIELYILCSDKIAAEATKLELTDFADLHNDDKYL